MAGVARSLTSARCISCAAVSPVDNRTTIIIITAPELSQPTRALFPGIDPEGDGSMPPELPFKLMIAVNKFDLLPTQVRAECDAWGPLHSQTPLQAARPCCVCHSPPSSPIQ